MQFSLLCFSATVIGYTSITDYTKNTLKEHLRKIFRKITDNRPKHRYAYQKYTQTLLIEHLYIKSEPKFVNSPHL